MNCDGKLFIPALMKSSRTVILLFLCFFYLHSVPAQASGDQATPQVQIDGTQLLKIKSSITGQDYVLYISLPRGYNDTSRTFPVLYVLDAQWDFSLVYSIYGEQFYDGFVPGMIIVGITWGGENPDYGKRRAFDLTPSAAGQPSLYGNADKFLSFIDKEAVPFIEKNFRAKKNGRTLAGSSFGGLFTLYALFKESEVFDNYMLTSPAWGWDNGALYENIGHFSKIKLDHPVRVFMAVGEYEDVPGFERLSKTISDLGIAGLEMKTMVVKEGGHSGSKAEGYARGFQYAFARPCINIDSKILERYTGEYEIDGQNKIRVTIEKERLVVFAPGNEKIVLCAESEKEFYVKGIYLNIRPSEDKDGNIMGVRIERYEGEMFAKKVQ